METITQEEMDYFLGKIDFKNSRLDAKAIDIMNRINTLFIAEKEKNKIKHQIFKMTTELKDKMNIDDASIMNDIRDLIDKL